MLADREKLPAKARLPIVFAAIVIVSALLMPSGAERPLILRYDPNLDPILRIGVSPAGGAPDDGGTDDFIHLRWVCEKKIKRELEGVEGVAAIQVRGGLEEEIRVEVDPYKLAAQNLDPSEVARRLQQENLNASAAPTQLPLSDLVSLKIIRDVPGRSEMRIPGRRNF